MLLLSMRSIRAPESCDNAPPSLLVEGHVHVSVTSIFPFAPASAVKLVTCVGYSGKSDCPMIDMLDTRNM